MILVDTSVLIDYLKGSKNSAVEKLDNAIEHQHGWAITPVIYQEVLQGARNEKEFEILDRYLKTQQFVYPMDAIKSYHAAAYLFFNARKKGKTVRSATDCLIAQIAIDNKLALLHNDNDYNEIAKASKLKTL